MHIYQRAQVPRGRCARWTGQGPLQTRTRARCFCRFIGPFCGEVISSGLRARARPGPAWTPRPFSRRSRFRQASASVPLPRCEARLRGLFLAQAKSEITVKKTERRGCANSSLNLVWESNYTPVIKLDFWPEIGGNFASPLGGIWGPKAATSEPRATAAPRSRST